MQDFSALRLCIIASIFLLVAACSGLSGEPQIVTTLVPPTPEPTDIGHPLNRPDAARGALIYADKCYRCHGERGRGDGELVASGQVQNVPSFLDPATVFDQTPSTWYQTITNGNVDKLMPPWKDDLSADDRWSVALYTYTLHSTPDQVARGHELFMANCAECHGETGRGDGPKAAQLNDSPGDLADFAGMAYLDDQAIYVDVNEGIGDVMPPRGMAFGGDWSEEDIRSVVSFVRTLALANPDAVGRIASELPAGEQVSAPLATEEVGASGGGTTASATAFPDQVRVTGTLTNGTANGALPASAEVTLFAFDASFNQTQYTTTAAADGSFAFENVPYNPDNTYITTVDYRDRVFASSILRADGLAAAAATGVLDLPITVYELTDDPGVVRISGVVSQVVVAGDSIQVTQVLNLTNTSDRAFTSSETTDDGRPISVVISLPPGAVIASLGGGDSRYVVAQDRFALLDTAMVLPGEDHLINVVYLIPYGGGAIIEQPINYALSGPVRLLVRPTDLGVNSTQLLPLGEETVGSSTYASYGGTLNLNTGDVIRYELSGTSANVGGINAVAVTGSSLPLIIGIVLVLVGALGVAFYIISRRNQSARRLDSPGVQAQIDALAAAVAQLDVDHQAGKIDDAEYQTQRAALKARMARLMSQQAEDAR